MEPARKIFRFFVFSNLFIACCALIMVYQTCDLLLHTTPAPAWLAFIFFGTISSYSFHWYLTEAPAAPLTGREQWHIHNRWIYIPLFIVGVTGSIVSTFFLIHHWPWLLLTALITFLYSAPKIPNPWFRVLRKIALAKTIFLAFVWMYVTTMLPLELSGQDWQPAFTLFSASRFFLIYAICILFDYRDREHDKQVGIRSLITWLSFTNITRLFVFSLLIFVITTLLLLRHDFDIQTVLLLLVPGIVTASLYRTATRQFSDMLYYFILDGLMALSSILTLARTLL